MRGELETKERGCRERQKGGERRGERAWRVDRCEKDGEAECT